MAESLAWRGAPDEVWVRSLGQGGNFQSQVGLPFRFGPLDRNGDVAEWFRQGPAKPSTWVRFPASPLVGRFVSFQNHRLTWDYVPPTVRRGVSWYAYFQRNWCPFGVVGVPFVSLWCPSVSTWCPFAVMR